MTARGSFGVLIRVGGVGAAVLALAASSTDGQRAAGGRCPAGEQCADDTPEGLAFEGAQVSWFVGNGVAATAVGGRQTVRLTDSATELPLDVPFRATATNPAAHGAAVAGPALVTVTAPAAGQGLLRISRVEDDYLFDQIDITSRAVDRLQLRPTVRTSWPSLGGEPWALYAGGTTEIAVALYDAADGWLVDEGMTIATDGPSVRTGWDAIEVTPTSAGSYGVRVSAGTVADAALAVPVVDAIATVRAAVETRTQSLTSTGEVCFIAEAGGYAVYGNPWRFDLSGPATPLPGAEQDHPRCLKLRFTAPGTVVVTGSSGGLSATTTVTVVSGAAREPAPGAWVARAQPGQRALGED